MPLVRISHPSGKTNDYANALSKGVHTALVQAFGIPEDDYFQIVTEHLTGKELRYPENFLGIKHGKEVVFVQITAAEGRTVEQKKTLYKMIAELLNENADVPQSDVIINLVETKKENWSFGNGVALFA
ncbi:tautomerase family protein [Kiloniella antarctica]|uniref:Tautomerase family protein n=1 Tax=Kiloniella antarctica TaxID=1550907 RepID=A0ABW5BJ44_9PROT